MVRKKHVHYTEQDSEAGLQENMGDHSMLMLDIAGQIVCAQQWLQCVLMLVIFLSYFQRFLCQDLF